MRLRTPVLTILFVAAAVSAARAQGTTAPAMLYAAPGQGTLATVAKGTVLAPAATSGDYVRVDLRGYIATSLLGGKRDSFPVSISATGARLRAEPSASATVVAELQQGMAFHVLKRAGSWTQVERSGWLRRSALPAAASQRAASNPTSKPTDKPVAQPKRAAAQAAQTTPKPQQAPPLPGPTLGSADTIPAIAAGAVTPSDTANLSPAPGVAAVATVKRGAVLIPTARDRGWVRVRLEGWVREGELVAADSSASHLSAADLRVSPDQYVGKVVRWTVTSLAFQTADPLRRDMRPNEPYLLARGPDSENALLYLAIPPALVEKAKGLSPMTKLVITARIRTGRADPSGVPILDVQAMTTVK